jgi:O-antigen ligase
MSLCQKNKFFSKVYFIITIVSSFLILIIPMEYYNNNWISITILMSFTYLILSNIKIKTILIIALLLLLSAYAFLVFGSRGVAIAAALSSVYLALSIFEFRILGRWLRVIVIYALPFVSIAVALFGVWLYRSPFYGQLVSLSLEETGKSLDSSRLARWDAAYEMFLDRPIFGWGLNSHIARVTLDPDLGNIHNLWLEFLFRGGAVGAGIIMVVLLRICNNIARSHPTNIDVVAVLVLSIMMSVYALGGVTHWPGSFMVWLVFGSLHGRAHIRRFTGVFRTG